MCRIDQQYEALPAAPAACLITLNNKLLVIKTVNQSQWSIPKRKIDKSLSAQCNAHKAVWQATGFNVKVGRRFSSPYEELHYFACSLEQKFATDTQSFPVPDWASRKVSYIALIDPFNTQFFDWSEDINLIEVREMFNQLD